jgi:dolichol-phosphate mannosyltransferase
MPELTVVVPTLNERDNLVPLLEALDAVLSSVDYEVVFVDDDSRDGTADLACELAQSNPRVRVLQRIGRRGLASAVVEGMLASSAPYLGVIDSDLQHDETILPLMLKKLKEERLDLVVATRHIEGGSMGEMAPHRVFLSRLGQFLSSVVSRTRLSDPMSGFFVVTRAYLNEVVHSLSNTGFKILLDLVASARRPARLGEVGYKFRPRLHGESKLDIVVSLEYLELIVDKLVGDFIPVSYVIFGFAGTVGILASLLLVHLFRSFSGMSPDSSQLFASIIVIGTNFLLNNQLTFRSARLSGWNLVIGIAVFYVACSIGLFLNLWVFDSLGPAAPWYLAAAAGLIVGSIWNYWISAMFVWQVRRRRGRHLLGIDRLKN